MFLLILTLLFIGFIISLAVVFVSLLVEIENWCEKNLPKTWRRTFWFIAIFFTGALMIWDKL
jgi:uncharacterized BrkB/YihY/UPF0761 family membrane protein